MYYFKEKPKVGGAAAPHPLSNLVTLSKSRPLTLVQRMDWALKCIFDFVVALLGLVCLAPIFLIIAWLIRRDSPGPIFYRGLRAGRTGKPFKILKFRTMYHSLESDQGPKVTAHGDERITPYGKWLRQTKINELPQLWNVLIGEMSLVGPRPEDVDIVDCWPEEIRKEFLSVRPGLTSPTSIMFRNEEDQLDPARVMKNYLFQILPSKLRLDLLYIRNRNILTDIDVIVWTAVGLLPNLRKASIAQDKLIFGPLARFYTHYLHWPVMDTIVAFLAVTCAGVITRLERPINLGIEQAMLLALAAALLFSLVNFIFGLHRVEWSRASWHYILRLATTTGITVGLLVLANTCIYHNILLPDSVCILSGSLAFFGFSTIRYRERLLTGAGSRWIGFRGKAMGLGERVLVIGAGANFSLAAWLLERNEWINAYTIVGIVDDDPRKQKQVIEGYRVVGTTSELVSLVQQLDIGLILYTVEDISPVDRQRILNLCRQTGVQIVMLPASLEHFRLQMRYGCDDVKTEPSSMTYPWEYIRFKLGELECLVDAKDWAGVKLRLQDLKKAVEGKN